MVIIVHDYNAWQDTVGIGIPHAVVILYDGLANYCHAGLYTIGSDKLVIGATHNCAGIDNGADKVLSSVCCGGRLSMIVQF